MRTALLLIAHGSRNAEANDDLFNLAKSLKAFQPIVEPAFLELAEPSIESAGRACVAQGAERVILLPYFLSAGVHVQRDLTRHRECLAMEFTQVDWRLAAPIGRHPLLREILLQRAREADDSTETT